MTELSESTLKAWETFYLIVGGAAGALTGLQFVVLTLISESGMMSGSGEGLAAFGSPNIVHFSLALLVSAILSAPWHGLAAPGVAVAACGVGGVLYSLTVLRRALRQRDYKPVLEDWTWHAAFPLIAYAACVYGGVRLPRHVAAAPFFIGGAALLLVFVGIHNAWDTVVYSTLHRVRAREARRAAARSGERSPTTDRATGGGNAAPGPAE